MLLASDYRQTGRTDRAAPRRQPRAVVAAVVGNDRRVATKLWHIDCDAGSWTRLGGVAAAASMRDNHCCGAASVAREVIFFAWLVVCRGNWAKLLTVDRAVD
jgi:hypothetical protein